MKENNRQMKSMSIYLILNLIFVLQIFGQNYTSGNDKFVGPQQASISYMQVDCPPRFPGCNNADEDHTDIKSCTINNLLQYMYTSTHFPRHVTTSTMCVIQFSIAPDGSLINISELTDPSSKFAYEAVKAIKNLQQTKQKWTPGIHQGKAVTVRYRLPVRFTF